MDVAVLYINGLGNGRFGHKERFLMNHWQKTGASFVCASVNWYDGQSLGSKVRQVNEQLRSLLEIYGRVVLLGSSAGASLALHVYAQNRKKNLRVVLAHGRLRNGRIAWPDYRTLEWAAHLTPGSLKPKSQVFYDSVMRCEAEVLPKLGKDDLPRILVLTPLMDFIVPLKTMSISGTPTRRSLAIGHKLAGLYDLAFARDKIMAFAGRDLPD